MKTILLTIVLAVAVYGQSTSSDWQTGGLLNGRFWNAQTKDQKELFLLGYATGSWDAALLIFARAGHDGTPILKELFPLDMSPQEVALAVDRFYGTPENIRVAVNAAVKIVAMRVVGADDAAIQKATANARAIAAK